MLWNLLMLSALVLAAVPALVFLANLRAFRPPPEPSAEEGTPEISVLIPARNEEGSIGPAVESALASRGVALEVIVLDDHSEDATAAIVAAIAARDSRLVLRHAPTLPAGWCGKQHACAVLAQAARFPTLVFLDADVRLAPDALARMAAFLDRSGSDLASGIPRQETEGLLEKLVIPLIHFVLLGFLPIARMRRSTQPSYAAGCGQLFITRRASYEAMGGHAAIRASLHDGITLPRAFRAAGLRTDLFDATGLATCRMYRGPRQLWDGLAKNAGEGLGAPRLIGPATVVLVVGQVLPAFFLALAWRLPPLAFGLAIGAAIASYLPRVIAVRWFRQSPLGAALHPLGVLVLVAIQWYALARDALGRPATWKGRPYSVPDARSHSPVRELP